MASNNAEAATAALRAAHEAVIEAGDAFQSMGSVDRRDGRELHDLMESVDFAFQHTTGRFNRLIQRTNMQGQGGALLN